MVKVGGCEPLLTAHIKDKTSYQHFITVIVKVEGGWIETLYIKHGWYIL